MPVPIEALYRPSPRDLVSAQWGILTERLTNLDNLAIVSSPFFTPTPDQIAYLTALQITATPGAALIPIALNISVLDAGFNVIGELFRDTVVGGAGVFEAATVSGLDIPLVGGRHSLVAQCNFSGADPSNECTLSVFGYAGPKGNAALF